MEPAYNRELNKIKEIKEIRRQKGNKRFKRQFLLFLAIFVSVLMVIGIQFGVAAVTSKPITFPPPPLNEQYAEIEERVGSINTSGMTFPEKRKIEDFIVNDVGKNRLSWVWVGIGTNETGLSPEVFKNEMEKKGIPINIILQFILKSQQGAEEISNVASSFSEISSALNTAHNQLITFLISGGTNLTSRDLLDQTGKGYIALLTIILFYIWLIVHGPQNLTSLTLSGTQQNDRDEQQARYEVLLEQSQKQLDSSSPNFTIQLSHDLCEKLLAIKDSGLLDSETQKKLLAIKDSGPITRSKSNQSDKSDESKFSTVEAANTLMTFGDRGDRGGRKSNKNKKDKSQQGGGDTIHFSFTEENCDSFMSFLKYSCSPFAIYIELLMDFIEEVLLEKIKVNNKLETILEEFIIPDSTSVITSSSEKVKPNSSKSSTFLGSMIWPTFVPTFGKYATTIGGKKSKNKNKTRKIKRNYSKKRKSNKGKKAKKLRKSKK